MFQYLIMLIDSFSSGFVFLRLICPAILNPRMFNIISGEHLLKSAHAISSLLTLTCHCAFDTTVPFCRSSIFNSRQDPHTGGEVCPESG